MLTQAQNSELTDIRAGTLMGNLFRRYWIPALLSDELPYPGCPPVRVRLLGEDLVAYRDEVGTVGLLYEFCPHRGVSLFLGRVEDCGIRCIYHGWKFDEAGRCLDTPNERRNDRFKEQITTQAYPCLERGGLVWSFLGPGEFRPDPPEYEWATVPADYRTMSKRLQSTNFWQPLEGDIDGSHVAMLHSDLGSWMPKAPGVPPSGRDNVLNGANEAGSVPPEHVDVQPRIFVESTDAGAMIGARRDVGKKHYWRFNQVLLPCFTEVSPGPAADIFPVHACVPMDNEHTWVFTVEYCPFRPLTAEEQMFLRIGGSTQPQLIGNSAIPVANAGNGYLQNRALQRAGSMSGIPGTAEQDFAVQESQGSIQDRTREHLCSSDIGIVKVRRRAVAAARALEERGESPPGLTASSQRVRANVAYLNPDEDWEAAMSEVCGLVERGVGE